MIDDWMTRNGGIWRTLTIVVVSSWLGWWSRQLTLEIPPPWFREDVQQNSNMLGQHEQRIDQLEKSDRYAAVVERLIELEKLLKLGACQRRKLFVKYGCAVSG